jgi:multicomponent Na+:H+ antiporter subunit G
VAWLLELLAGACLLAGALALLVAGVGVLRMPDVYTRLHAASVADTLGAGLVILGLILSAPFELNTLKLLLILFFLWFTSPVFGHVLVKVAYGKGLRPWLRKS